MPSVEFPSGPLPPVLVSPSAGQDGFTVPKEAPGAVTIVDEDNVVAPGGGVLTETGGGPGLLLGGEVGGVIPPPPPPVEPPPPPHAASATSTRPEVAVDMIRESFIFILSAATRVPLLLCSGLAAIILIC
jgi:hypothetical protein